MEKVIIKYRMYSKTLKIAHQLFTEVLDMKLVNQFDRVNFD